MSATAAPTEPPGVGASEDKLPTLRQDLQMMRGRAKANGAPQWLIFDAVANRYVQIDSAAYEILTVYPTSATQFELLTALRARYDRVVSQTAIAQFVDFLIANALTVTPADGSWRALHARNVRHNRSFSRQLLHSYLFIRIPLVRPDRFLRATLPIVRPLMSRTAATIVILAGVFGLYFISRQWDTFAATFLHFFSLSGFALYGASLIVTKTLHELGHAYAAARFGCRVPTMGVAFLVMFPVLYTDTTDVWRLSNRRQRLLIAGAGIIVELALAAIASLAWVFLPDGIWRSLAFTIATASWILTLAVNLNPFMRFDGYYLLADALGVENLQSRSFALGRWRLREMLFGLKAENPEPELPPRLRTWLTVYAWLTWIYRLILFIGIALLVYFLFFKALGVFLFLVEIIWFIGRPIYSELKVWWEKRERIMKTKRTVVTCVVLASLIGLAVVPWSTRVAVPGVIEPQNLHRIFAPEPARLLEIAIKPGDAVTKGSPLAHLEAPQLAHDRRRLQERLALVNLRLRRIAADPQDRAAFGVLRGEKAAIVSELAGIDRAEAELTLRSPVDGRVASIARDLHVGRWIGPRLRLFVIHDATGAVVQGYVSREDLGRFDRDAKGIFIPDDLTADTFPIFVRAIGTASAETLAYPELASTNGGSIATRENSRPRGPVSGTASGQPGLIPTGAHYHVRLSPSDTTIAGSTPIRGLALVEGRAESFAARAWRQVLSVLIRESGF